MAGAEWDWRAGDLRESLTAWTKLEARERDSEQDEEKESASTSAPFLPSISSETSSSTHSPWAGRSSSPRVRDLEGLGTIGRTSKVTQDGARCWRDLPFSRAGLGDSELKQEDGCDLGVGPIVAPSPLGLHVGSEESGSLVEAVGAADVEDEDDDADPRAQAHPGLPGGDE